MACTPKIISNLTFFRPKGIVHLLTEVDKANIALVREAEEKGTEHF